MGAGHAHEAALDVGIVVDVQLLEKGRRGLLTARGQGSAMVVVALEAVGDNRLGHCLTAPTAHPPGYSVNPRAVGCPPRHGKAAVETRGFLWDRKKAGHRSGL